MRMIESGSVFHLPSIGSEGTAVLGCYVSIGSSGIQSIRSISSK